MVTKMVRVNENDYNWLISYIIELQNKWYGKVSLAEAISTLITEHRAARGRKTNSYDISEKVLKRLWEDSERKASKKRLPIHIVYGQAVANHLRLRHGKEESSE